MNRYVHMSTPPKINVRSMVTASNTLFSLYLSLLILLVPDTRNAPGARPYCNHQPLKIPRINHEFFFTQIIFNMVNLWYFPTSLETSAVCNYLGPMSALLATFCEGTGIQLTPQAISEAMM